MVDNQIHRQNMIIVLSNRFALAKKLNFINGITIYIYIYFFFLLYYNIIEMLHITTTTSFRD